MLSGEKGGSDEYLVKIEEFGAAKNGLGQNRRFRTNRCKKEIRNNKNKSFCYF